MKPTQSIAHEAGRVIARGALGLALAALAVVVELAVMDTTSPAPFLLVYPAVLVAAWWGGRPAGGMAILTSAFALAYWFLPPTPSFAVAARRDALDLVMFCGVSMVLVELVVRTKRALAEAYAARRTAEAATDARDTVLAVVAHDLRNPLQTIGLTAELLAGDASWHHEERADRRLMRIRSAAARARRLVDDLLDGASTSGAPVALDMSRSSLPSLVDETLSPFMALAEGRSIELELPRDGGPSGAIVCDRDRIIRVLSNLVDNALKYTQRGGKVAVDVRRRPDGIQFEVSDTGQGMTKDELSHAFERRWRGPGPGHGFGLGLWISKVLVEAHGGALEATSTPRGGTRMSFFVPQPDEGALERAGAPALHQRYAHP
jgi:signal transduction histidine kinase